MSTLICTRVGPHLVEVCESPNSAHFSRFEVVTHTPTPPKPPAPTFPPRDLATCQELLRSAAKLLDEWVAIGKADGIHGQQLRAVLAGERP